MCFCRNYGIEFDGGKIIINFSQLSYFWVVLCLHNWVIRRSVTTSGEDCFGKLCVRSFKVHIKFDLIYSIEVEFLIWKCHMCFISARGIQVSVKSVESNNCSHIIIIITIVDDGLLTFQMLNVSRNSVQKSH